MCDGKCAAEAILSAYLKALEAEEAGEGMRNWSRRVGQDEPEDYHLKRATYDQVVREAEAKPEAGGEQHKAGPQGVVVCHQLFAEHGSLKDWGSVISRVLTLEAAEAKRQALLSRVAALEKDVHAMPSWDEFMRHIDAVRLEGDRRTFAINRRLSRTLDVVGKVRERVEVLEDCATKHGWQD